MFIGEATPVGSMGAITLSDSAQTLEIAAGTQYTHVLVQVRDNGEGYSNSREIVSYRVDDTAPTITTGFKLGDGDYRIFTRGEIENGVKMISAEAGLTGHIQYQAYNNIY